MKIESMTYNGMYCITNTSFNSGFLLLKEGLYGIVSRFTVRALYLKYLKYKYESIL